MRSALWRRSTEAAARSRRDIERLLAGLARNPTSRLDLSFARPKQTGSGWRFDGNGVSVMPAQRRAMVGRGQAVRRGSLDPVFEGSNPSAPTSLQNSRAT